MKKKVQKRIIGRAAKTAALVEKRGAHVGKALAANSWLAKDRCDDMRRSWGPLTKGPYRKPGIRP